MFLYKLVECNGDASFLKLQNEQLERHQ